MKKNNVKLAKRLVRAAKDILAGDVMYVNIKRKEKEEKVNEGKKGKKENEEEKD